MIWKSSRPFLDHEAQGVLRHHLQIKGVTYTSVSLCQNDMTEKLVAVLVD